ncbi:GspB domain-containing protein [Pseudoduganella sp. DS3]|uniref:GspB domain-containing protein n=1 Tax=Pseudoduganella guangdongensis TaxID=2692179 RepID=A0A6N9HR73_9BURK|nr:general secretion pathway protein GspB [Pseudoduganella guangdongensis]MYN05325.1 GspB domain-containing protein [Pseudoduganella guangdongensis]
MSYILEALKKAQAERQIGSTPTIHAPTLASAPQGQSRSSHRTPVIVAMVLMGAAIAGLATMLVRQQPSVAQPPAAALDASVAAPPAQAGLTTQAAAPPAAVAVQAEIPAPAAAVEPEAVAKAPPVAAAPSSASASAPAVPAKDAAAASAARAIEAPAAAPAPAAPPAPAPLEEHIQSLQDLPEPIQRAIPQIALGGYMYSKNPADRLLLIDKVLRKEGEEVAPGLLLERLQPKQAVFRFRGYRYKVPL